MKTRKNILFVFFAMVFLTVACKKESNTNVQNLKFEYKIESKIPYSEIQLKNKGFKGSQGSNKILVFSNMEAFKLTLSELDRQVRELDSAFVTTFSNLGEDSINLKAEELGFDEKLPLFDFANFFAYYSLFMRIDSLENIWLNNEILDDANEPDNHFIFELSLRAILNEDCEVQINDTIYKLSADGYYAIANSNLKSLSLLDKYSLNSGNLADVIFIGDACSTCKSTGCKTDKRNDGYKYNSSNNLRIKWVVSHWTHPWDRRCAAKTDNYKKHNNHWDKYRADCFAKTYGSISDAGGDCNSQVNFNPSNTGLMSYYVEHVEHKIDVATKTKSGWVKGDFTGCSGAISHTQILTW